MTLRNYKVELMNAEKQLENGKLTNVVLVRELWK